MDNDSSVFIQSNIEISCLMHNKLNTRRKPLGKRKESTDWVGPGLADDESPNQRGVLRCTRGIIAAGSNVCSQARLSLGS